MAVLLSLFVGMTGAHRCYLGYKRAGAAQTIGFAIGQASVIMGAVIKQGSNLAMAPLLYYLIAGGFGVWVFVDLIRIATGRLAPVNGWGGGTDPQKEEVNSNAN